MAATQARHKGFTAPRAHRGVGMIEVLLTVLVLSIGLMGLAALQGFSLQSNQTAYHRTQAVNLAHEIMDDIRANNLDPAASQLDTAYWDTRAASMLPDGDTTVNIATDSATVTVSWLDDRNADGADSNWSIVMTSTY